MKDQESRGRTAAEALLGRMAAAGVEVLFANGGTDFPSIIEAYAAAPRTGTKMPEAMVVTHENVAVGMAHGYYLMSGKPAGVIVHVNVGLANSVMGIINAAADNIPVLMCSGRSPLTEAGRFGSRSAPIHWGQEMRDQSAMIREVVKWDYELRYPEQAGTAVDRAMGIALSEPRGPVYLSLPREVLAESPPGEVAEGRAPAPTTYGPAAPGLVAEAARMIAAARRPVVITQGAEHQGGFGPVVRLAEGHGLPVVEHWATRQSLPTGHAMHGGRDPNPWLQDADVVVVLNAMVPWIPISVELPEACRVIAVGPEPMHRSVPMRSFPVDVSLAGGLNATLAALADALDAIGTPRERVEERAARVADLRAGQDDAVARRIAAGSGRPMSAAWVSKCLSDAADEHTTFFNELGFDPAIMSFEAPMTFFSSPLSGGLGWGVPAALGAQLADRSRQVIACVGDGSYLFANPAACHQTAATLKLPLLTVVFSNGIWNAVKRSTLHMYPDGEAAAANVMPITDLGPRPDTAAAARAYGAHAERVVDGQDLPAAIERALEATRNGRQALLEVVVTA